MLNEFEIPRAIKAAIFMGCIRMKKTIVIMAASLLLAACGAEGTYYEKSPASVAAAIADAELSPMLAGEAIINSNPEMSKAVNQGMQAAIAFEKMEQQAEFEEEYGSDWGANTR